MTQTRRGFRLRPFLAVLAALMAAPALHPAFAETSIKVIVNDEPITTYDISQRARLLRLTTRKRAGAARKAAIDELIEERLKVQEAKRRGAKVSDSNVASAFANIAARAKLTAPKLTKALKRAGVNPETLKNRIRSELLWTSVVRSRFRAQIKVSEQDVIAAMLKKEDKADKATTTQYDITQIIFVVPKNAANSLNARRKREADALRNRFTSCDSGVKLAEGLKEVVVKPGGRRLGPELPAPLLKIISDVPVGHTSKPVKTGNGYELYAVCGKKVLDSDAGLRTEVEDELRVKEGQMMSRRYLRDLRRDAVIEYR